jgi:putative MATE family efflux protein
MSPASPSSGFLKPFLRLFIPSATQSLFFSLIGIFDVLMVGQMGDVPVAAVGLAGQFFFLLNLTLFGTAGGAAMFAAQYWGAHDLPNLRRVLGLCLGVGVSAALVFASIALIAPGWVMGLFSQDAAVIQQGVSYLRIIGWSYVFTAVTVSFSAMIRSTGNTRLPMLVSVTFLCLNTLMNYGLIFGHFGLPALGVRGAATGTTIARILESLTLLIVLYSRRSPVAGSLREYFTFKWGFVSHHLRLIFLIFLNEFFWALGVNVYNAIIARMGTSAYAAYNVTVTFQYLGLFLSMGCATTSAILVGHAIGAGEYEKAYRTAGRILLISVIGSFGIGLLLIPARYPLMDLYQVSPEARQDAAKMLLIAGLTLWIRCCDAMFIVGILRSGGDSRFSTLLDLGAIWLAGIPVVALTASVLRLPVEWVFLAILTESAVKAVFGLRRYLSRRWLRNITSGQTPALPPLLVEN